MKHLKNLLPLIIALILVIPHAAYAKKQLAKISGTQSETHASGATTAPANEDNAVHASGATTSTTGRPTSDAGKVVSAIGKAIFKKDAGPKAPGNASTVTHEFNDDHPAPGEVRTPRQPKQATVEQPRSPAEPRAPQIPRNN